jgi:hypothetical protein
MLTQIDINFFNVFYIMFLISIFKIELIKDLALYIYIYINLNSKIIKY